MDEFKQIKMSVFLILLLQFTGAATGQRFLSLSVRVGDEATLPCNDVKHFKRQCYDTTWNFTDSASTVELVKGGQIGKNAKSDRLRVTENCSLVIKKVTEEDAGDYTGRQIRPGPEQQDSVSVVVLSVVTMTEDQDNDEVTLNCSVTTHRRCEHSVKWLLQGRDVDKDQRDIKTSQSVTFPSSHFSNTSWSELYSCEVTAGGNVQTFSLQSAGEDTAAAAAVRDTRSGFTKTASVITEDAKGWWWWIIVGIVGVAALIIIITLYTSHRFKVSPSFLQDLFSCLFSTETSDE
ncbi:uncharacterized protein LOC117482511 isoform X1 [Trematomus bernacchii]|uniref:uncharacterized protein LOC117482511 isoform X1 n=1 Tax=Trematomus bernacchii TaxID=40690 RepID=UPI00146F384F|nr:uncharacterized protein LOC117482511 isoform X1 [Trematomus bernacchii]XP_033986499.1 uncharacterized protein LOC117482511 isoform X1 [Trematomus bernacchii]